MRKTGLLLQSPEDGATPPDSKQSSRTGPTFLYFKMDDDNSSFQAKVLIAPNKTAVASTLSNLIIQACYSALVQSRRNIFTIALSGGSLPSLLRQLPEEFDKAKIDPQWEKWHVILADERCVLSSDEDSNLGAIRSHFTNHVGIPTSQIYGIDESLLLLGNASSSAADIIAKSYQENVIHHLLEKSSTTSTTDDGMIDCAILGFGPDGHTCSLFPNHNLLNEQTKLVASIDDSPKPPPSRITLTLPFLNRYVRQVLFCGVGESKCHILKATFNTAVVDEVEGQGSDEDDCGGCGTGASRVKTLELCTPAPFPCGMVRPLSQGSRGINSLVWVVDEEAAKGVM